MDDAKQISGRSWFQRRRRFLGWLIIGLAAALFLWRLEAPQRLAADMAARYLLGVQAECRGIGVAGGLHVKSLRLYATREQRKARQPFLEASGLRATYALFPSDRRFLRAVHADAIALRPDFFPKTAPASDAPPASPTRSSSPSAWEPFALLAYLPVESSIDDIKVSGIEKGYGYSFSGISVQAGQPENTAFVVSLTAKNLTGSLVAPADVEETSIDGGSIDLRMELRVDGSSACRVIAQIPRQLDLNAAADLKRESHQGWLFSSALDTVRVDDPRLAGLVLSAGLPAALRASAQHLDVSGSEISGRLDGAASHVAKAMVRGQIGALRLVHADAELFSGDIELAGTAQDNQWDVTLALAKAKPLRVRLQGLPPNASLQMDVEDWRRADLMQALPAMCRDALHARPVIDGASASITVAFHGEAYSFNGQIAPRIVSGGRIVPCAAKAEGQGVFAGEGALVECNGRGSLGEGALTCSASAMPNGEIQGALSLENVDAPLFIALLGMGEMTALRGVRFMGDVKASYGANGLNADCAVQSDLAPLIAGQTRVPLVISGPIVAEPSLQRVKAHRVRIDFPDFLRSNIQDFALSLSPLTASGKWTGALDLAGLAALAGVAGVYGEAVVRAPLQLEGVRLNADMDAVAAALLLPFLPEGSQTPLRAKASMQLDLSKGTGRLGRVNAVLGEGGQLGSDNMEFVLSPLRVEGPFTADIDLAELVSLGLAQAAIGKLTAKGGLRFDDAGVALTQGALSLQAETFVLPDNWAALAGLNMRLDVQYLDGITGQGQLGMTEIKVAGASLRDVRSPLVLEGGQARLETLEGRLFGGNVAAAVLAELLAPGVPVRATVSLSDIDLDAFTREFKPPQVVLTGIASGSASAAYDTINGLANIAVALNSTRDFTVNRDFLAQLFLSQYLQDVSGGKSLERVTRSVLGEASQRPFDSAALELQSKGKDAAGQLKLKSKGLNLTADLRVDAAVLEEALALRQEAALQDIEAIRSAPVELSER